ncbi:MAG: hypothetical protein PHE55_09400, partial [Methylococcaceae bacterium]|nr:hypothetical protein [Methylococcaceae bacterium]
SGAQEHNGYYVTPGLAWMPNRGFNIAGGYGVNSYFAHLRWEPSQRTGFQVTYRYSSVGGSTSNVGGYGGTGGGYGGGIQNGIGPSISGPGSSIGGGFGTGSGLDSTAPVDDRQALLNSLYGQLGNGNIGPTWNGSFHHRTRNTLWTASYGVSTYTSQQALTSLYTFSPDPIGGQLPNGRYVDLANLTNDLITSKRAQISFAWTIRKTNINLNAYHTDIAYQTRASSPQDNIGFNASLNWKFSPQNNATLLGTYQITNFKSSALRNINTNQRNELQMVSLRFTRNFTSFLDGYLEARHTRQNGGSLASGSIGSGTYDENRVTASIDLRF